MNLFKQAIFLGFLFLIFAGEKECREMNCQHDCQVVNGQPTCQCRVGYKLHNLTDCEGIIATYNSHHDLCNYNV